MNKFQELHDCSRAEDLDMDGKCLSSPLIATCNKAIHQYLSRFRAETSWDPQSIRKRVVKRTANARVTLEEKRFDNFKQKLVEKGNELKLW